VSTRNKKIILCDLDGILNMLYPYWFNKYGIDYNVPIDIEKMIEWDVANLVPHGELIYKYMEEPGFYKYAPVMPGAQDGIRQLEENYNVIVYTACDNKPHAYADKATFMDYYFPGVAKIIGKNYKHLFDADCLIDDSPKNQKAFKAMHLDKKVVSIRWPYNQPAGTAIPTMDGVPVVDFMAHDYRTPEKAWGEMVEYIRETV
jgi:5'-nucleotidase